MFPSELVEAWVRRSAQTKSGFDSVLQPPSVLAGSLDPLLDWDLRESGLGIAAFLNGSLDGLTRLGEGKAIACGMHVFEPERDDGNAGHVAQALCGMPVVLIEWATRQQHLDFQPLFRERHDLAIWRRDYFEGPVQALLSDAATDAFQDRAAEMGGYDIGSLGKVRMNGAQGNVVSPLSIPPTSSDL